MTDDRPSCRNVVLELKCCCCGIVLETLPTPWRPSYIDWVSIWTRQPCAPCEDRLAAEDAQLQRFRRG